MDGRMEDGTRYIISYSRQWWIYELGICKFIYEDGTADYFISAESEMFIPENGQMVFIYLDADGKRQAIVLQQWFADEETTTKRAMLIKPVFHLFGGVGLSLAPSSMTKTQEHYSALYAISEDEINLLTKVGIKEVRISERSTYNSLKGAYLSKMSSWIYETKLKVDSRGSKSVNLILEDID